MISIPLTKGQVAIIDDCDLEKVSGHRWFSQFSERTCYAKWDGRSSGNGIVYMHRVITGAPAGFEVDHIDGNGLNNRRSNLRISARKENARNQKKQRERMSKFKGVSWYKRGGKWRAYIFDSSLRENGKSRQRHLGYYDSEEEAAKAYDAAAILSFGEFASLNFPKEDHRGA